MGIVLALKCSYWAHAAAVGVNLFERLAAAADTYPTNTHAHTQGQCGVPPGAFPLVPSPARVHAFGGSRLLHVAAGARHSAVVLEGGLLATFGHGRCVGCGTLAACRCIRMSELHAQSAPASCNNANTSHRYGRLGLGFEPDAQPPLSWMPPAQHNTKHTTQNTAHTCFTAARMRPFVSVTQPPSAHAKRACAHTRNTVHSCCSGQASVKPRLRLPSNQPG